MTIFKFSFLPISPAFHFKNSQIRNSLKYIFLKDDFIKGLFERSQVVIDIIFERLDEFVFPAISLKFYIIGRVFDLDSASSITNRILSSSHLIPVSSPFFSATHSNHLGECLINSESIFFDFYEHWSYFKWEGFCPDELCQLQQINFKTPQIIQRGDFDKSISSIF